MRKICLLVSLLIAFQLSAQKGDFDNKKNQNPPTQKERAFNPEENNPQGAPGKCDKQRPPFKDGEFKPEGQPFFGLCPEGLSDKDKEQLNGYLKELRKTTKPLDNELHLRRAELDYLVNIEEPNIDQIGKKIDEISLLENKVKLEQIKFQLKIKKSFPNLDD